MTATSSRMYSFPNQSIDYPSPNHPRTVSTTSGISPRSRYSFHSMSSLDSVPEDPVRPPPTSYRGLPEDRRASLPLTDGKGKQRDSTRCHGGQPSESKRADWVVDTVKTQNGTEDWMERPRIILILGDATPESLAPILYNSAFSNTILLVGSEMPQPAIESLLSPSFLLATSPTQTIHPTLQTFTLPKGAIAAIHPLPALIAQATILARQFRQPRQPSNTRSWSRSRDSYDSASSPSPPLTPPPRLSNLGIDRRGSSSSIDQEDSSARSSLEFVPGAAGNKMATSSSSASLKDTLFKSSRSSRLSGAFLSASGSRKALSEILSDNQQISAAPVKSFDAVINFIPPASSFTPQRALQDMLQQAVMTTTAIVTAPNSRSMSSEINTSSLVLHHVLPADGSGPLPFVIESFLLSFLPSLKERSSVNINGRAISSEAWQAGNIDIGPNHQPVSAAEILLFGGVECSSTLPSEGVIKPRAFISDWSSCVFVPGVSGKPESTSQTSSPSLSQSSSNLLGSGSPPISQGKRDSITSPFADRRRIQQKITDTPELEHSTSSSASSFALGEVASTNGLEGERLPTWVVSEVGKKSKGLGGWLKTKVGIKT